MKKLLGIAFSMFLMFSLTAQEQDEDLILLSSVPESLSLVKQAKAYADAVTSGQYRVVAEMTHQDIIEMGGGVEYLIGDLKNQANQLAGQNLSYVSADVGNHPEFLNSDGELQTVIPIVYHLMMGDKKVESWVNLFASSNDEGQNWSFVNLEKFDDASLRTFVKNVSKDFVFPN